jgi:hypothetical protein
MGGQNKYPEEFRQRVASSPSINSGQCRVPAPTACQRGRTSATRSARTCRDSPVTRRSATARHGPGSSTHHDLALSFASKRSRQPCTRSLGR